MSGPRPSSVLALAAILTLFLAAWSFGQETAAFLKITPGARPMAMGEAFTAIADDLNALAANPAGISRVNARQAAFMHAELYAGTRYDFAGYAHPFDKNSFLSGGALGLGVQRLSQAALEGRSVERQPTGSFAAADTAFNIAYGQNIPGLARLGLNVKLIESRLAENSARTVALDAGVMRLLDLGGFPLIAGAAAQNIGPGLRFGQQTNALPLTFAAGVGIHALGAMLISADVKHRPHPGKFSFALGTEYAALPVLSLRAGYAARLGSAGAGGPAQLGGGLSGLGFGFGVKVRKVALDYSFSPAGDLGNAQRLSLSFRF